MTIKAQGSPLSMTDLQAEYGADATNLGALFRGGALVPATAPASANFQTYPMTDASNLQVPTSGTIQFSHFYGQVKAAPSPILLKNTGEQDPAYWIAPLTGTIYVTIVGAGGSGGLQGSGWGGYADSGGGGGGGGGGQIIYQAAVAVTQGVSYPYYVKPVTYVTGPNPYTDPETGEPIPGDISYAVPPRSEMFGMLAANGGEGFQGDHSYNGGQGGATGGNSGNGGRGGNSRINTQGLPGSRGTPLTAITNEPWRALGGNGGAAGTGYSSQSLAGSQGYGFGGGFGGAAGYKGSDNPDTAGGGGGGGGGFVPVGYTDPSDNVTYTSTFLAPSTGGLYFGSMGCIYIEFEPAAGPPPPTTGGAYTISDGSMSAFAGSSQTTATARLTIYPDGTWATTGGGGNSGRWLTGSNGSAYELNWYPDPNSVDYPSVTGGGNPGWRPMSTNWVASVSDADSETSVEAYFYVTIREIADTANSVTVQVELSADGRCFAVGTLVRTPEGDRTVESIVEGDVLCSFAEVSMLDEETDGWRGWKIPSLENVKTDTTATVRGTYRFTSKTSVKINGIHSTLEHTYFVFDGVRYGWKVAGDITTADSFVDADLNHVPVTEIEMINEPAEFIAINVETLDTLQVKSGDKYILAHNISA